MKVTGMFDVSLEPQKDEVAPAGRMVLNKVYSGGMDGTGVGQMISKRTDNGVAVYAAIEVFEGSIAGKQGAFTLIHNGYMSSETQSLEVRIIEGSGSGELENISGGLNINQEAGGHNYELQYHL